MPLPEAKLELIKESFERNTGINRTEILEIQDSFPGSRTIHLYTAHRTFNAQLTLGGRMVKGSIKEDFNRPPVVNPFKPKKRKLKLI